MGLTPTRHLSYKRKHQSKRINKEREKNAKEKALLRARYIEMERERERDRRKNKGVVVYAFDTTQNNITTDISDYAFTLEAASDDT